MAKKRESPSKKQLELRLSGQALEIPPLWDALLIGRQAPVGPEAAKRMADSLAPGQFELIRTRQAPVEAVLVRKNLLKALAPEVLTDLLLEELAPLISEEQVVRVQVEVVLHAGRSIRLE
ncbi:MULTISPECIES: hypothetical protein [Thermus]|uniref:Uncharacterized protein n=1 Tax=Thermus scotoductus (strain ATCC 700910 / SA-01) TaxID=743525 RepID=E8PLC1_THESS|nr:MULTISPECIES: hypothetical protein [Thermus]ADW21085.1 conserved hypothetical protein [Thermus scotoductus SA-01]